jgi:tRNA (mo5U34)-methyltransferase
MQMDAEELRSAVGRIQWFHTIDLGQGIVTPGRQNSQKKLARLGMPADLTGKTVLDIGAWDGFFSFEAERRGAARVLATDVPPWGGRERGTKAGFGLARQVLGSKVEDRAIDVMDISREELGEFDLVLFLGVLYHLRHPLLALERVYEVSGEHLILETHVHMIGGRRPLMVFYPTDELARDRNNWWGPNVAAVHSMLRDVGFSRVELVCLRSFPERLKRAAKSSLKDMTPLWSGLQWGRATLHAWR